MKLPFPIHGWKGLDVVAKSYYGMTMGLDTAGRFFPREKHRIYRLMDVGSLCTSRCVPEVRNQREVGERARKLFFVVYIWVAFIGAS